MANLSARPLRAGGGINCPLCGEPLASFEQYERHVGRHQEQLALFSLPSIEPNDIKKSTMEVSDSEGIDEVPYRWSQGDPVAGVAGSTSTGDVQAEKNSGRIVKVWTCVSLY